MLKVSIMILLVIAVASQQQLVLPSNCPCGEGGKCVKDRKEELYCKCKNEFIGKQCELEAVKLNRDNQETNSTITEEFSVYYIEFIQVKLLYVQIAFCPIEFQNNTVFTVNIDFLAPDGSLKGIQSNKQLHSFHPHQKECVAAKYVLFPTVNEATGEILKLAIRVKSNYNNSEGIISMNKIGISYRVFQFDNMQNKQLGQFLIVSSLSSAILFCITFAICKRLSRRRERRFIYHPAHVSQSIAHFDLTMPSSVYLAGVGEQQECLICLLCVENTEVRITPCNHLFHKQCIDQWGQKSQTCPACRQSLRSDVQ